jgi:hypothetical protein
MRQTIAIKRCADARLGAREAHQAARHCLGCVEMSQKKTMNRFLSLTAC